MAEDPLYIGAETFSEASQSITSTVNTAAAATTGRAPIQIGNERRDLSENLYSSRGRGKLFNTDKYQIENLSYPTDLMNIGYGDNYVIFYINVSVDSKMVKNERNPEQAFVEDIDPRDRGDLIAKEYSTVETAAATGVIASGVGSAIGLAGGSVTGGGLIGAGLGVAAVGAVASQSPSFTRPQKRLSAAIAMHVPNSLQIRYSTQYADEDTAGFATAAEVGRVMGDTVRSISESAAPSFSGDTIDRLKRGISELGPAATALGLNAAPSAVGAAAGLAPNPKKEQVFKGVDFRSFVFDYQFYPRDAQEAENVYNIINTFKYHMHPEFKDSSNFLYIYPSEFDIAYYHGPAENRYIHRHTSCVLTEMNVNYTPNAQFTTFSNGMPTQINVSLSFRELALLTKDKVADGL